MPARVAPSEYSVEGLLIDLRSRIQRLCQPEIQDLYRALRGDLDIGRLQIAVHDTGRMRRCEGIDNLFRDREGHILRESAAAQTVGQRQPFDELEHEAGHAVGVFELVYRSDMGMIQRRQQASLAREPRQPFLDRREVGRQHLDGDGAVQASIARAIHLAHAAGPEEVLEDVTVRTGVRSTGRDGPRLHGSVSRPQFTCRGVDYTVATRGAPTGSARGARAPDMTQQWFEGLPVSACRSRPIRAIDRAQPNSRRASFTSNRASCQRRAVRSTRECAARGSQVAWPCESTRRNRAGTSAQATESVQAVRFVLIAWAM